MTTAHSVLSGKYALLMAQHLELRAKYKLLSAKYEAVPKREPCHWCGDTRELSNDYAEYGQYPFCQGCGGV